MLTGYFNCKGNIRTEKNVGQKLLKMIKKHNLMIMDNHKKLETKSILDNLIIKTDDEKDIKEMIIVSYQDRTVKTSYFDHDQMLIKIG